MKSFFLVAFLLFSPFAFAQDLPLNSLKLPKNYKISIYADSIKGARQMCLGDNNIVFVGTTKGNVYALVPDAKNKGKVQVVTIAHDLNMPTGVACYRGDLYVAETNRISKYEKIAQHLNNVSVPVVVTDNLPNKSHHGLRVIKVGPDQKLYVGVGAPCNACIQDDPRFATIIRMDLDGKNQEIYASGVRNTVGFDWDPMTHHLWFTDNGRDWLGDDLPPDEINYAPEKAMHFGFPYFYGDNEPDPIYGRSAPKGDYIMPKEHLAAHVAALGMAFYSGKNVPEKYRNQILIAEHGSWNRSSKVGYQIEISKLTEDRNHIAYTKPFITGWLQRQKAWGRPVDILVMPDGSFLISDDYAGVVYKVWYQS